MKKEFNLELKKEKQRPLQQGLQPWFSVFARVVRQQTSAVFVGHP